jgi:hypothetical protein
LHHKVHDIEEVVEIQYPIGFMVRSLIDSAEECKPKHADYNEPEHGPTWAFKDKTFKCESIIDFKS